MNILVLYFRDRARRQSREDDDDDGRNRVLISRDGRGRSRPGRLPGLTERSAFYRKIPGMTFPKLNLQLRHFIARRVDDCKLPAEQEKRGKKE